MHLNFAQNQLSEFFLNVKSKVVVFTTENIRSLGCLGPEFCIGTGQNDLHEIWIVQFSIKIRIEEFY